MTKIVHIKHEVEKIVLSKSQKTFNNLIKKIDAQKKILVDWENSKSKISQRVHGEYQPLVDSFNQTRAEMVHLLDRAHGDSFFKKADKAKLKALISDLAFDLIQQGMDELKEIYNRYNDTDFDAEAEEIDANVTSAMKSMMEDMFGMEFDDADFSSSEQMREALQQRINAQRESELHQASKRTSRKKTAKQLENEAREKEEAKNASKSIQEVFRKLVAVLHPDREPDEIERERKTKLMQRVNEAYSKKDLLQLFALQLEIEQIDQTKLNTIAEDKLKHFNKILQEQLNELMQEINDMEYPFRTMLNAPSHIKLTPDDVLKSLSYNVRELKTSIKDIEREMKALQNPVHLKAMLKTLRF
ncbi:MAG: hypothetical protein PHQ03_10575 [Methylococcales bacterium]|nr:hypothetical protein [Methylococcales bacterium]